MKHTVFISYCHQDTRLIERIEPDLGLLGLTVWRDVTAIHASQDISAVLQHAIERTADLFLVALTNNAIASHWVQWEQQRAADAESAGWPIAIVYAKLDSKCYVPDEIKKKRFLDLSSGPSAKYYRELLTLARFCLARHPYMRLGVYDLYESYADMDQRRQNSKGETGCTIEQFVAGAQDSIVAVGYWFSNLFGPDSGKSIHDFLLRSTSGCVDLYLPDHRLSPVKHLSLIHEMGPGVVDRIATFVEQFRAWGGRRHLTRQQAQRCRLHLMRLVPTNSFLCLDHNTTHGRMIVHPYAVGIQPSREVKLELRFPKTPLYSMYAESLGVLRRAEYISATLTTSFTEGRVTANRGGTKPTHRMQPTRATRRASPSRRNAQLMRNARPKRRPDQGR